MRTLIHEVRSVDIISGRKLLRIVPINASGTEKRPSGVMVVAAVRLDAARKRRSQSGASRGYPVQDDALYTLGIIRPRTGDTLLDLE